MSGGKSLKYHSIKPSPLRVACVAFILVTAVAGFNLVFHYHGEILGFFRIGTILPVSPYVGKIPEKVRSKGEMGYDGQFFLALAMDPGLSDPRSVAALDNPRYRYRRILYPFLANILSFGHKKEIPYILVALNIAFMVGVVFVSALWFRFQGASPWWGLFALGVTGGWTVLFLSTADLMAGFLLIFSLYAYVRGRVWAAALGMAAAGITHETLLLILGAFWLDALFKKDWRALGVFTLSTLPAVIWNLHILEVLPPTRSTTGILENFTYPFGGVVDKIRSLLSSPLSPKTAYEWVSFLLLTVILIVLSTAPSPSRETRVVRWSGIAYLIFYSLVSFHIFSYYLDVNRIFMNAGFLFVLTLAIPSWRRIKVGIMILFSLSSLLFVAAYSMGLV